eukprot:43761_1
MSLDQDVVQEILEVIGFSKEYKKMDIACYKARNLPTSWRSKRKHKETNQQIQLMQSVWRKAHRSANANLKRLIVQMDHLAREMIHLKSMQNHEGNEDKKNEDEYIHKASTPDEILFQHDEVPLYICDQNKTEYTTLGTGQLVVIYNKQSNTAQILLLSHNECLLNQIMCNVLQQCTYNQMEQCIDWIGNNHADGCDTSKIIKCRVYFDDSVGKQLVLKFLESYNTCWNDHGSKCIHHVQTNSAEAHPKPSKITSRVPTTTDVAKCDNKELDREAMVNKLHNISLHVNRLNKMCLQIPILHMTYQYECVLISLRHKMRYNLFESNVIPRCVPNNVIVHQLRGSKAIRRLYKRPTINSEHNDIEHRPIFDDFILHKNDDRVSTLLPDMLCVAHLMPKYFTSTFKVKSYCYLLEYFVFGKHSELFAANMRCFVQLICYSKTAHLCSKCVLKYVQRSDGLNQMFGFIQQFINTLAQSDITKIVKEIYGVIAVIRMLSNLLLYPLVIRYMFSVSTFYRKLFRFWMALTRFIWNFKSTKHKLEHIPLDQHLIDMIIVMIKASKFDTVDESAVTLIAINNDSIHLFELLLDLMVHILNDFIYVSTRYWRKRHFKYVLKHARIVLFLVDWFKNEFEAKHHQFSQANLKKQYHIRGLKQYCNGNMVESVRIAFEKGLLNAFQTISCDSEYILKLRQVIAWYIAKKTNVNNLNAWNVLPVNRLNGSSGKAQQLFWKAVHLQYKCEIATMDINAYQKMKITFVGRYKKCQHCETIKQDTDQWYVCNGCRFVFYCSRRCQKVDWNQNNHRRLCNVLRTYPHNISALGLSTNL